MDDTVIAKHLETLDHRLGNVEQLLRDNVAPRLHNVEQILLQSIEPRLANVEQILPTLATKEQLNTMGADLRQEIRDQAEQSRRHTTMLIEHQDTKLQLLAEHVLSLMEKRP